MKLPTKLYHYSREPVSKLVAEFYDRYKEHWPEEGSMKPCGLWFSVEDYFLEEDTNWYDWCVSERFRIGALRHKYRVHVAKDAKILWLQNANDIMNFSKEYHANDPFDFGRFVKDPSRPPYVYSIKWSLVKSEYDGIIIAPYQWGCRNAGESTWYYPWDCASGCIWNLDKVKLDLECLIDVDAIEGMEESEESAVEGSSTDSLLVSLVPLT